MWLLNNSCIILGYTLTGPHAKSFDVDPNSYYALSFWYIWGQQMQQDIMHTVISRNNVAKPGRILIIRFYALQRVNYKKSVSYYVIVFSNRWQ